MAFQHRTLTLTGAAQQIVSGADLTQNRPLREIQFQADGGNSNPIFIGQSGVSTSDWGIRIPTPTTNVPIPPIRLGPYAGSGPMKPGDFYVIGTLDEALHICWVEF